MKYSKATNYALHTVVLLGCLPKHERIGVKPLAEMQGLSPTYLSKVLTTLAKENLVESSPGVNGGYRLSKSPEELTFLDIIEATEGKQTLFTCTFEEHENGDGCLIQQTIDRGEQQLKQYLAEQTIQQLVDQMDEDRKIIVSQQKQ